MDLSQGGHLTHGSPVNFSGLLYKAVSYGVERRRAASTTTHDARKAREHRPKMIIAGYSAYSRVIDFAAFAEVAKEIGAIFMVDMAHFAGLVGDGRTIRRRCRTPTSSRRRRTRRCAARAAA